MADESEPEFVVETTFDIKNLNFRDILISEIIQDLEDTAFDFGRASMVIASLQKAAKQQKIRIPESVRKRYIAQYERASSDFTKADKKLRNLVTMLIGK